MTEVFVTIAFLLQSVLLIWSSYALPTVPQDPARVIVVIVGKGSGTMLLEIRAKGWPRRRASSRKEVTYGYTQRQVDDALA